MKVHGFEKPYPCNEQNCDEKFVELEFLKDHLRRAHGAAKLVCGIQNCDTVCVATFTLRNSLRQHKKRHHADEWNLYKCMCCSYSGHLQHAKDNEPFANSNWMGVPLSEFSFFSSTWQLVIHWPLASLVPANAYTMRPVDQCGSRLGQGRAHPGRWFRTISSSINCHLGGAESGPNRPSMYFFIQVKRLTLDHQWASNFSTTFSTKSLWLAYNITCIWSSVENLSYMYFIHYVKHGTSLISHHFYV